MNFPLSRHAGFSFRYFLHEKVIAFLRCLIDDNEEHRQWALVGPICQILQFEALEGNKCPACNELRFFDALPLDIKHPAGYFLRFPSVPSLAPRDRYCQLDVVILGMIVGQLVFYPSVRQNAFQNPASGPIDNLRLARSEKGRGSDCFFVFVIAGPLPMRLGEIDRAAGRNVRRCSSVISVRSWLHGHALSPRLCRVRDVYRHFLPTSLGPGPGTLHPRPPTAHPAADGHPVRAKLLKDYTTLTPTGKAGTRPRSKPTPPSSSLQGRWSPPSAST